MIIEDAVEEWTNTHLEHFTLQDIAEGVGIEDRSKGTRLTMHDQHRLGAALDGLGFKRKRERVDGALKWVWIK